MIRTVVHTLIITSLSLSLAGCQSGPRWSWWKKPTSLFASKDESPALPSASATPQAVAATGLEPAASPSATNLAAARGTASATSPPADLTAPLSAPSTNQSAPPAGRIAAASPPTSAPTALANVPPTGPYDPSGYQRAATANSVAPSAEPASAMGADRYAMATAPASAAPAIIDPYASPRLGAVPSVPVTQDRYATAAAPPPSAPVSNDPYAPPGPGAVSSVPVTQDRYVSSPAPAATPLPSELPGQILPTFPPNSPGMGERGNPTPSAVGGFADATTSLPTASPIQAPAPSVAAQAGSTLPVGQYRPGGTSSFSGLEGRSPIEVAARPSPTAPAGPPMPVGTPAAAPWAPPSAMPSTTGNGTRTY